MTISEGQTSPAFTGSFGSGTITLNDAITTTASVVSGKTISSGTGSITITDAVTNQNYGSINISGGFTFTGTSTAFQATLNTSQQYTISGTTITSAKGADATADNAIAAKFSAMKFAPHGTDPKLILKQLDTGQPPCGVGLNTINSFAFTPPT